MASEHVDPVYKYIDGKIKLIKRELQQLKVAHDAVANQYAQALLELQRLVAGSKVNSDTSAIVDIIDSQLPNKVNMRTQVVAEAASLKQRIMISDNPLKLAAEFYTKWEKALRDLGADVISY